MVVRWKPSVAHHSRSLSSSIDQPRWRTGGRYLMWSWGIRQIGIDFRGSASDASVYGWIRDGRFSDDIEGIGGVPV